MAINLYSKDSVDDLLDAKLSISSLSNAATVTLNAGVPTAGQALTYDGTDLIWATVGGGGGLTISTLSNGATSTLNPGVPSAEQVLVFDGTDLAWHYPTINWGAIGGTLSTQMDLQGELDLKANLSAPSFTSGISVDATGITFSDSTTQTTAAIPFNGGTITDPIVIDQSATSGFTTTFNGDGLQMGGGQYISQEESNISGFNINLQASGSVNNIGTLSFADSTTQTTAAVSSDKAIANAFAASMWYAWDGYDYARNGVVNTNYIGGSYLSAGISDGTTFAAGFPATNATLNTGSYWYVSINGTLSDLFIFSP